MVVTAAFLALGGGGGEAQRQGTVRQGAGVVFRVSDLTRDNVGRIVASSRFQVSLTLPAEVQNVGVNASKQAALIPTVDKSDGRVIYLDVVKPGGFATLNIRLVNQDAPLILKMTVELGDATGGVLSYTITDDRTSPAAASTRAAPQPVVQSRPVTQEAATPPSRPATAAPVQPRLSTPRPSAPAPAPASRTVLPPRAATPPVAQKPPVTQKPQVTAPAAPPVRLTPPADQEVRANLADLRIEASLAPGQTGPNRIVTFQVRNLASTDTISYILLPRVAVRANGQTFSEGARLAPQQPRVIGGSGIQGTVTLNADSLSKDSTVLLFEISPVNRKNQQVLPSKFLGVVVRQ